MQHINLETLENGAFSVQENRAIQEVAENIQDPNTEASAALLSLRAYRRKQRLHRHLVL